MNNNKRQSGFTLMEMVVTVGVFAIVSMVSSAIFINVNNLQQQTGNLQRLQNEGRYLLEKIAREIRGRELDYGATNFNGEDIVSKLVFKKDESGEILSLGRGADDISGNFFITNDAGSEPLTEQLNSNQVMVEKILFYINSNDDPINLTATSTDIVQPRVTILMKIKNRNVPDKYIKELNLQTTISSKIYKQ